MIALLSQPWFLMAIGAAIAWGIGYNLDAQLMKAGISPVFLMIVHIVVMLPLYIYYAFAVGEPGKELKIILSDKRLILIAVTGSMTILGGSFLILSSISEKNATVSSMIEISYPFFVALFAWLVFRENHINAWTALGGLLIFCGVGIVLLKS